MFRLMALYNVHSPTLGYLCMTCMLFSPRSSETKNIQYQIGHRVPANMTHFFQPLDLTVNGAAKRYMKKEFAVYYSLSVKQQLDSRKTPRRYGCWLSLNCALHVQCLFNFFTSWKRVELIMKRWKKAGIVGVLDGTIVLPSEDPFSEFLWTLYYVSHSSSRLLNNYCVSWILIVWEVKLLKLIPAKSTIFKIC